MRRWPGSRRGAGSISPTRSLRRTAARYGCRLGGRGTEAGAAPQLRGASTFFSRSRKPSFRGTHSSEKEGRRSTPNLVHPGHTDALVSATPERAARIVMDTESEHIPAARPGQGINPLSRSIPNAGRPNRRRQAPFLPDLRKPVMPLVRGAEPGFDSPSGRWSRPPSGWSLHPIQDRFDPDRRKAGLRDAPGAPLRRGPGAFAPGPRVKSEAGGRSAPRPIVEVTARAGGCSRAARDPSRATRRAVRA